MIFIDTNYFLRLLLKDNQNQYKEARATFDDALLYKNSYFTSTIVIFEIYWVLSSFYEKRKVEIASTLEEILKMTFIKIEERKILIEATKTWEKDNLSFEDCYNIAYAKSRNAKEFRTFDKALSKRFPI